MDSIIRQAVREELRRSSSSRPETASSTNQDDQRRSENESGAAGSSRSSFSSRTVGRLSGLLNRMRKGGGKESSSKKRKVVKEHRIQVRWLHYDPPKKAFVPVRQKNGGGNRFIAYTNDDPPSLEGAACRPTSHTCGPLLELPSTYSNFVELREQFNNILNKGNWEMDIM